MVTPEAPVSGVNIASRSVVAMARPPGIQPTTAVKRRSKRRLAPPSDSTYPASVNNGTAGSIGLAASR